MVTMWWRRKRRNRTLIAVDPWFDYLRHGLGETLPTPPPLSVDAELSGKGHYTLERPMRPPRVMPLSAEQANGERCINPRCDGVGDDGALVIGHIRETGAPAWLCELPWHGID